MVAGLGVVELDVDAHPASSRPPDLAMDGGHVRWAGRKPELRSRPNSCLSFLRPLRRSTWPVAAQHAGRWHQQVRALHHQWCWQIDRTIDRRRPDRPDHSDRGRKSFLTGGQTAKHQLYSVATLQTADRSGPYS